MDDMIKIIIVYLILINIIALIAYGADKRKAIKGKWRISEKTLLGIAALGGSIGALTGIKLFHHKTKHKKFTVGVPIMLTVQVIVFVLVLKAHL